MCMLWVRIHMHALRVHLLWRNLCHLASTWQINQHISPLECGTCLILLIPTGSLCHLQNNITPVCIMMHFGLLSYTSNWSTTLQQPLLTIMQAHLTMITSHWILCHPLLFPSLNLTNGAGRWGWAKMSKVVWRGCIFVSVMTLAPYQRKTGRRLGFSD